MNYTFVKVRIKKNINTSYFLKEELEKLEEKYIVERDNELIMQEELDDICYHQNSEEKQNFIYNDMDSDILKVMDVEPSSEY
ncbi:hypothetical protein ATE84_4160 [Aquimarina sp. MAR_2010_214]|uniref:hypothetical protein n=1 Tax=Aquimarina sp. MAR_2010_214 TaxID=1250026 RepID=UPI000C701514|nr:hypothetical protein [Aquimarina sp. MAR_2010_214]PKV52058.1 hypothetical protein ATE84_4160 [Aquimarina sp. MAR_2010_214]